MKSAMHSRRWRGRAIALAVALAVTAGGVGAKVVANPATSGSAAGTPPH